MKKLRWLVIEGHSGDKIVTNIDGLDRHHGTPILQEAAEKCSSSKFQEDGVERRLIFTSHVFCF